MLVDATPSEGDFVNFSVNDVLNKGAYVSLSRLTKNGGNSTNFSDFCMEVMDE